MRTLTTPWATQRARSLRSAGCSRASHCCSTWESSAAISARGGARAWCERSGAHASGLGRLLHLLHPLADLVRIGCLRGKLQVALQVGARGVWCAQAPKQQAALAPLVR